MFRQCPACLYIHQCLFVRLEKSCAHYLIPCVTLKLVFGKECLSDPIPLTVGKKLRDALQEGHSLQSSTAPLKFSKFLFKFSIYSVPWTWSDCLSFWQKK